MHLMGQERVDYLVRKRVYNLEVAIDTQLVANCNEDHGTEL